MFAAIGGVVAGLMFALKKWGTSDMPQQFKGLRDGLLGLAAAVGAMALIAYVIEATDISWNAIAKTLVMLIVVSGVMFGLMVAVKKWNKGAKALQKFAKAMNFSSTKNPRRREMNPNVPSCTTDLLYCLLHLTLDCPENEPIFRKYRNDKSLTELERRIATMKEVGFYMLDPDGSKSRDAFLKDIYAFYKEHHVPTSDNLIEKIDSPEGIEWYMPVYNNFDAVTSSNLIDISNMTDSTVKDRASMEKRYTIDQLKGSINDAARSALVDSYFDKYRPTEMNMFPYWLYMYPVCGFSQQIKPFQMLPVYDKGVYKISKYRYLQWKIIGVDENG
jgi:hypothetical protein